MIHDVWMNSAPYLDGWPRRQARLDRRAHAVVGDQHPHASTIMQANADSAPTTGASSASWTTHYYQQAQAWQQVRPVRFRPRSLSPTPSRPWARTARLPWCDHGETVAELAEAMGVDAGGPRGHGGALQRAGRRWASDEDFGKDGGASGPRRRSRRSTRCSATSTGACRPRWAAWWSMATTSVLNIDDEPIAGLFATGNTTRPLLRWRRLPHELPGPLDRPRHHQRLHSRPRRRESIKRHKQSGRGFRMEAPDLKKIKPLARAATCL